VLVGTLTGATAVSGAWPAGTVSPANRAGGDHGSAATPAGRDVTSMLAGTSAVMIGVFAGRAVVAVVLGAVIGLERQWRQRTAGLRTNALVALGAALFELYAVTSEVGAHGEDPTRVAAYVVSAIGFLGAGVILREGVNVRGINTAATIWCSAAVGVLSGAGYLPQAVIGAVLVVGAHLATRPLARWIEQLPAAEESEVETIYQLRVVCREQEEAHIRVLVVQSLAGQSFTLRALRSEDIDHGSGVVEVTADLRRIGRDDIAIEAAVSRLSLEPCVSSVTWNVVQETLPLATAEE
jgi:putative Mg2+ transporter-C (MgtC) family protein